MTKPSREWVVRTVRIRSGDCGDLVWSGGWRVQCGGDMAR